MLAFLAKPLIKAALFGIGVTVLIGGAWLWYNAQLQAQYRAGYADAASKCQVAQYQTRIANLERDIAAAKKQEAAERERNENLTELVNALETESKTYAEERAKLAAKDCLADDPAVAHDRRLRQR